MPFNVKSILKTLKEEIETSRSKQRRKGSTIILFTQKLDDTIVRPSLWDYEEILGFIKTENC